MSEVTGISSSNLDSSLCFIQPGISHDVHCTPILLLFICLSTFSALKILLYSIDRLIINVMEKVLVT